MNILLHLKKYVRTDLISGRDFLHKLSAQLINNFANCMNFKISLTSLNKLLKDVTNFINDECVMVTPHVK